MSQTKVTREQLEASFAAAAGRGRKIGQRQEADDRHRRRRRGAGAVAVVLRARQAERQEEDDHRRDPAGLTGGSPSGPALAIGLHPPLRLLQGCARRQPGVAGRLRRVLGQARSSAPRSADPRRSRRPRCSNRVSSSPSGPSSRRPAASARTPAFGEGRRSRPKAAARPQAAVVAAGGSVGPGRDQNGRPMIVLLRNPRREVVLDGSRRVHALLDRAAA